MARARTAPARAAPRPHRAALAGTHFAAAVRCRALGQFWGGGPRRRSRQARAGRTRRLGCVPPPPPNTHTRTARGGSRIGCTTVLRGCHHPPYESPGVPRNAASASVARFAAAVGAPKHTRGASAAARAVRRRCSCRCSRPSRRLLGRGVPRRVGPDRVPRPAACTGPGRRLVPARGTGPGRGDRSGALRRLVQ